LEHNIPARKPNQVEENGVKWDVRERARMPARNPSNPPVAITGKVTSVAAATSTDANANGNAMQYASHAPMESASRTRKFRDGLDADRSCDISNLSHFRQNPGFLKKPGFSFAINRA
jgi:hypothetical protein